MSNTTSNEEIVRDIRNSITICPKTRHVVFNGQVDSRYSFPVWAWMSSRGMSAFFTDGGREETIGGRMVCELRLYALLAEHKARIEGLLA